MDDDNYYCLFKSTHVLTGAYWIGLTGTVGCALALAATIFGHNWIGTLIFLLTVPFYVSLMYAHHKHVPHLYLPFLVANGLQTFMNALYTVFLAAMLILMPKFWQHHLAIAIDHGLTISKMRLYTGLLLAGILVFHAFLCWSQSIVFNAYKYMREEQITLIPPDSPEFGGANKNSNKKEGNYEHCERESQLA